MTTRQPVGQTGQDYAESATQAVQTGCQQIVQSARRGYEQSAGMLAQRPMQSVIAALGVGLMAGIAIGLSIGAQRRPEPSWRYNWNR